MSAEPRRELARVACGWAVALFLIALLPFAPSHAVRAQSMTAATVAQLIAAITTANGNNLDNTITLTAGATYTLTSANNGPSGDESGLPRITGSHTLTITGNGAIIERGSAPTTPRFRIFAVDSGASLTLTGLTLRNGSLAGTPGANGMAGFGVSGGDGGNAAGGAIFNSGTLTVTDCLFVGNSVVGGAGGNGGSGANKDQGAGAGGAGGMGGNGSGGAIGNFGTLNVRGSTFTGNTTTGGKGGLGGDGGSVVIGIGGKGGNGGNGGDGVGGALNNVGTLTLSKLTLSNTTFVANSTSGGAGGNGGAGGAGPGVGAGGIGANGGRGFGGAISHGASGSMTLTNATVARNSAAGGAYGIGGAGNGGNGVGVGGGIGNNMSLTATAKNTLLATNSAGDGNCGGNLLQDGGYNLDFGPAATCYFSNHAQTGDPLLGSLVNHGGLTPTLDVASGGAAYGNGDPTVCAAAPVSGVDQRGRPRSAACSIGAFEPQPAPFPTLSALSPPSGSVTGGSSVTLIGTGFVSGATVAFGGVAATTASVVSSTKMTVTVPGHASGPVDVIVTNPDMQAATLGSGYTFGVVGMLPGAQPTNAPGGVPTPRPPTRVPGTSPGGSPPSPLPTPR